MPLRTILLNAASEIGLTLSNTTDRTWLIQKINEAAEDLYTSDDLVDSLREQVFSLEVDDQQISLPWYVYKIRGARWSQLKMPIRLDDMRPRYATMGYNEMLWRSFTWRIKEKHAIGKDITNSAPFVVSIPMAEMLAFVVTIIGVTSTSTRVVEQVHFAPGDTVRNCINSFLSVKSITKDILITNDISVQDINGVELAVIPNNELSSSYTILQIIDFDQSNFTNEGCMCVEVLYKTKFTPFSNDYDEFPCGPIYDQCIFYKFMEIFSGKKGEFDKATAYKTKCNELVGNIAKETEDSEEVRMDFGKNRFLMAQNRGTTQIRYQRGWPWNYYPNY